MENALLGTPKRPLQVVIIGSGPSGFYAAEALLHQKDFSVHVDILDRLPTPYGLVRGGVAPDHQKIKSVIQVYEKSAALPGFRFFGNIELGKDVQVEDLLRFYDCILYAVGNQTDKRLGIPGEDFLGSHAATAFVGWYNGHPDYQDQVFDLAQTRAAVIGVGNVAMDVTRILAHDPKHLAKTDIADCALKALEQSHVREIFVIGRRGPAQAAFSPMEIQEIAELESANLVVAPTEAQPDPLSLQDLRERPDPKAQKNVDFLLAQAKQGEGHATKKVRLRFLLSPVEILGTNGHVSALRLERNELVRDARGGLQARGNGSFETLELGLVFRSVGYHGVPIAGVPFDKKLGRIPNLEGRVMDPGTGKVLEGHYVVGWAKRGPTGLIGTNRADSMSTVEKILEDMRGRSAPASQDKNPQAALRFWRSAKQDFVSFEDWKILDRIEVDAGTRLGKVREKFTSVPEMLAALAAAKQAR